MFTFDPEQLQQYESDKKSYYNQLEKQLSALLADTDNPITNLSQASAFVHQMLPDLNWAGFYLVNPHKPDALILGPYQGKVACVHIPFGRGVCGTVAANKKVQRVDNVHEFDGHIACDGETNSEIVLPLVVDGNLIAVFDLDSPLLNRFDKSDEDGLKCLLDVLMRSTCFERIINNNL